MSLLVFVAGLVLGNCASFLVPPGTEAPTSCGYESCPAVKAGMINVHLVPHTHDDVGWLKTVDQYFYGSRNDIQNAGVQYILDSVIPELVNDPTKKFIYVEIAFFARWWREQTDEMKTTVRGLVDRGQLEFILGGWCMNDEASTHYNAIIDQHTLGFEFLRENFGECGRPRVAWQVDPFGHSREQASLFAQMGYDGYFFGRLDYQDKNLRLNTTTMEMLWHGSPNNLKMQADLFTGVNYNGYGPPGGFCFDQWCNDDPIMRPWLTCLPGQLQHVSDPCFCFDQFCSDDPVMDDERLHDFNRDKKIGDFVNAVHDQAKHYKTNHIMMTMGSDFQYQNAKHWFINLDKVIMYTNKLQQSNNSMINVFYSTPSCYLYQLNQAGQVWPTKKDDFFPYAIQPHSFLTGFFTSRPALKAYIRETNKILQQMTNASKINVLYSTPSCYLYHLNKAGETWPTKSDDFFPYASGQHTFWTGYFTSRAALKGYVRETNKFLQTCKQLDALAKLGEMHESAYKIQVLKEAMGVAQHHDAVSGTEKQHVAYDYAMRLATGRDMCKSVINDAMNQLIPKGSEAYPAIFFCDLLNISYCEFTEINKEFVLTVYNPVGHDVTRFVRLPVIGGAYMVNGPNDETVEIQIIPVSMETMKIPERKGSMAKNELVFQVSLPPLGYSSYFIKMSTDLGKKKIQRTKPMLLKQNEDFVMKNEHLSLLFDGTTGMIKSMSRADGNASINMTQDIVYYLGHPGNCSTEDLRPSGAYIFRPNNTMPESWKGGSSAMHLTGPVVDEVHTSFSPWATQVTRMYKGANYVELEWTVGPIPITDKWGKEVIARFKTGLKTNKMFYTDANGREIQEREKDFRPTWKLNQTEPVAGNYYPVNSRIYLKDTSTNMQFTVLNDRSQGGASLQDGELEIMLHRRLLYDDCLGCGEPLNETGSDKQGLIVRGKLYFFLDTIANSAKRHREMGLQEYMSPLPMFSATAMKYSEYVQYYHTMWSGLNKALPANVHLVTLEQWSGPSISPSEKQPYLLRLEHIYEEGEDPEMSKPATVSLMDMFVPFVIESVDELILGANLPMSELKRLHWNTQDNLELLYQREKASGNAVDVTLNPMQIRTFQVMLQEAHPRPAKDKFTFFS